MSDGSVENAQKQVLKERGEGRGKKPGKHAVPVEVSVGLRRSPKCTAEVAPP